MFTRQAGYSESLLILAPRLFALRTNGIFERISPVSTAMTPGEPASALQNMPFYGNRCQVP
eukprot:scaffold406526_cov31-Prasinocladus_malaysianus.AAC.1